ncbi:DUF262 domain-containing protein [Nocardia thraciensis]
MTSGLDSRPQATMFTVEDLMKLAWDGRIRVPHFQRSFRWQRHDVIRLFDSIVLGYPVGSLLLWRRSARAERITIGALSINAPAMDRALFVVDGQQRLTSLANALHSPATGDPTFDIAYDLRNRAFVSRPQVDDPTVIPLSVLFDLTKILGWFGRYSEAVAYVDAANEITKTLRQFQIPAYEVSQDDPKVLQDIFDRMNSYGKRLSRAEIFSTLFAQDEDVKNKLTFSTIAAELDGELGFGVIDDETVANAIFARRGPDVRREIRNDFGVENVVRRGHKAGQAIIDFPDEDRDTAYGLGKDALHRSIIFLQNHAGVPHFSLLPYRHILVVLTRFFAHFPTLDDRSTVLLRRWFWRAAVTGPEIFKGSNTGAIRFLNYAVKPGDLLGSLDELIRLVDRPNTEYPDLRRFRSNEASTKIILCSWWDNRPRSFDNGNEIDRVELAESLVDRQTALDAVRYIVPRTSVPIDYRIWAANRILLPSLEDDSKSIIALLSKRSLALDDDMWSKIMESHLIPTRAVDKILEDDVLEFLKIRQAALDAKLRSFLSRMCEWNFEDTPSLKQLEVEDPDEAENG